MITIPSKDCLLFEFLAMTQFRIGQFYPLNGFFRSYKSSPYAFAWLCFLWGPTSLHKPM